jgi:hypothetical protein
LHHTSVLHHDNPIENREIMNVMNTSEKNPADARRQNLKPRQAHHCLADISMYASSSSTKVYIRTTAALLDLKTNQLKDFINQCTVSNPTTLHIQSSISDPLQFAVCSIANNAIERQDKY